MDSFEETDVLLPEATDVVYVVPQCSQPQRLITTRCLPYPPQRRLQGCPAGTNTYGILLGASAYSAVVGPFLFLPRRPAGRSGAAPADLRT